MPNYMKYQKLAPCQSCRQNEKAGKKQDKHRPEVKTLLPTHNFVNPYIAKFCAFSTKTGLYSHSIRLKKTKIGLFLHIFRRKTCMFQKEFVLLHRNWVMV